jgi:replicative DNA helicase
MANINPKLPPQDIDSERSVIGAMMLEKDAVIRVADVLSPDDFYDPRHAKIFNAVLELFEKAQPIDILSVTQKLKEKDLLKNVGGSAYLTDLINSVPTATHVSYYAQLVKQKRVLRDLVNTSSEITAKIFDSAGGDTDELLDEVEQRVFSISQKSRPQKFVLVKDDLKEAYERIEKLHHGEKGLRGISTGFDDLDHYLSGLQKSDLIILGARPSLGKTSLCLDIARHAAVKGNASVGIFSLEMSRDQIIDRLIASEAQVPLWKLRTGRLNTSEETEFEMIREALDRLSKVKMYVDDTPSANIIQLRSMARRLKAERGVDLLVVDYLQLIQPRISIDNMVQGMTEVSRGLKSLARELQVPVLAAAQLSRAVEQRDVKIPRLSDLRESGSLEQEADVVLFIYRKDRDKIDPSPEEQNTAELIIAKHRNGPIGSVKLKFDAEKVSFKNIDKTHEAESFTLE